MNGGVGNVLLNKLGLYLSMVHRTGKTRTSDAIMRFARYSFMKANAPILPIYPKRIEHDTYTFSVTMPKPGELGKAITLHAPHGHLDIRSPARPYVNVGTVGHCDWPIVDFD